LRFFGWPIFVSRSWPRLGSPDLSFPHLFDASVSRKPLFGSLDLAESRWGARRRQRTEDETTLYRPTSGKKISGFIRVYPGLSGLLAGKNVGRVWSSLVEFGRVDSSLVRQARGGIDG